MKKASPAQKIFILALTLYLAAAFSGVAEIKAAAGGVQSCTVGSTCKIGEFLYDDSSAPISGATCTITSKYPDNSSFLSSQAMSGGGADGWYYHEFTTPSSTGVYATNVCCTTNGDTLCIDKGFESKAASTTDTASIASAVWSYSGRTVSSFGSLISDVWSSATRTLTGAGLSSGQLATQDDVVSVRNNINNLSTDTGDLSSIKKKVDENRLLLERIVNKPIIENVLEDTTPDLTQKTSDTRAIVNQLYINNQFLTAQAAIFNSKLSKMTGKEALDYVITLSGIIGESADSSSSTTLFAQANYLKDSWNWDESAQVYSKLSLLQKSIVEMQEELVDYEKSPLLATKARKLVTDSLALEKTVGLTTDTANQKTVFARLLATEVLVGKLNEKSNQLADLLNDYKTTGDTTDTVSKIGGLRSQVIALNKVPSANSMVLGASTLSDGKAIQNSILGLMGVVNSNKKLLALATGKTLINTWLELGSIVFKTIATNPSTLITQDVEIKYYLPAEIKSEDIIKVAAGLEAKYDAEKGQMYVEGKFSLTPGQTRTFEIETKDIWEVTQEEVASLRTEIEDLSKPLEKTAYFAQSVSLKSAAISELDKIVAVQKAAITPEDKIRAYREADILKKSVETKIQGLRELVGQASSAGSLLGFVGGSQTIAVWGIVIVVIAGFVILLTYMKSLAGTKKVGRPETEAKTEVVKKTAAKHKGLHPLGFAVIVIATSVITAGATTYIVTGRITKLYEDKIKVLGTQTENKQPAEPDKLNDASSSVPTDKAVVKVEEAVGGPYILTVQETPTGFLRLRETPNGKEIGQLNPGEELVLIEEKNGWYKVEVKTGESGWVSSKYVSKN